jgi:hypothetical protein
VLEKYKVKEKRILTEKKKTGKVSRWMWHLNWPLKDNGAFLESYMGRKSSTMKR